MDEIGIIEAMMSEKGGYFSAGILTGSIAAWKFIKANFLSETDKKISALRAEMQAREDICKEHIDKLMARMEVLEDQKFRLAMSYPNLDDFCSVKKCEDREQPKGKEND